MTAPFLRFIAAIFLLLLAPAFSRADDVAPSNTESKLREALRNTTLQLRDAQNQAVTLQAAKAQSDKDNADLKAKTDAQDAKIKSLIDQAAVDKAASDKTVADLNSQVADLTDQATRLTDALAQWKNAYTQVSQLETAKEAERVKFAIQAAELQRLVDDREIKNFALYKTADEILTRYEKFSLGEALTAKEPFVGITRVKLENLVQDYKKKILDSAVTSGHPLPPAPATPSAPSTAKPEKITQASVSANR